MTQYSYLNYTVEAEDMDVSGSTDPTKFPEGWAGKAVNNGLRAIGSALRNLGDLTMFAPADGLGQQAGTLARQNADAVAITGGTIDAIGMVPIGTIVTLYESIAGYVARQSAIYDRGFIICDGRTVPNPLTGANYTTPNLLGLYPFFCFDGRTGAGFGVGTARTTAEGSHAHGGATANATLSASNLPGLVVSTVKKDIEPSGTQDAVVSVAYSGGANHAHGIFADGLHDHQVDLVPPSVGLIPLIRFF